MFVVRFPDRGWDVRSGQPPEQGKQVAMRGREWRVTRVEIEPDRTHPLVVLESLAEAAESPPTGMDVFGAQPELAPRDSPTE